MPKAPSSRSEFAVRVRAARERAGLTQEQLVKAVGMTQSTIAQAETKGTGSSFTAQIAKICNVDAYWLATGEGEMTPSNELPFDRLKVIDLWNLAALDPEGLRSIEKNALGLLLLARNPNLSSVQQPDTVDDKLQMSIIHGKLPTKGERDAASDSPDNKGPNQRGKRMQGGSQKG